MTGNVSRETEMRLNILSAMVRRWNATINLVAQNTLADIENRHIKDSLQLLNFCPPNIQHWLDLGSGGGFPGLVVAAQLNDTQPECKVTLIEADLRKCVFLRQAIQAMNLNCDVIAQRIEALPAQHADVISARALAPLHKLLSLSARHLDAGGVCIFPKGQAAEEEINEARAQGWKFSIDELKSATDPNAKILLIRKPTCGPSE